MIVTTIRLQTTPENRKEILQTFRSLADSAQCGAGCKSCRIYRELGNDETVIVEHRNAKRPRRRAVGAHQRTIEVRTVGEIEHGGIRSKFRRAGRRVVLVAR